MAGRRRQRQGTGTGPLQRTGVGENRIGTGNPARPEGHIEIVSAIEREPVGHGCRHPVDGGAGEVEIQVDPSPERESAERESGGLHAGGCRPDLDGRAGSGCQRTAGGAIADKGGGAVQRDGAVSMGAIQGEGAGGNRDRGGTEGGSGWNRHATGSLHEAAREIARARKRERSRSELLDGNCAGTVIDGSGKGRGGVLMADVELGGRHARVRDRAACARAGEAVDGFLAAVQVQRASVEVHRHRIVDLVDVGRGIEAAGREVHARAQAGGVVVAAGQLQRAPVDRQARPDRVNGLSDRRGVALGEDHGPAVDRHVAGIVVRSAAERQAPGAAHLDGRAAEHPVPRGVGGLIGRQDIAAADGAAVAGEAADGARDVARGEGAGVDDEVCGGRNDTVRVEAERAGVDDRVACVIVGGILQPHGAVLVDREATTAREPACDARRAAADGPNETVGIGAVERDFAVPRAGGTTALTQDPAVVEDDFVLRGVGAENLMRGTAVDSHRRRGGERIVALGSENSRVDDHVLRRRGTRTGIEPQLAVPRLRQTETAGVEQLGARDIVAPAATPCGIARHGVALEVTVVRDAPATVHDGAVATHPGAGELDLREACAHRGSTGVEGGTAGHTDFRHAAQCVGIPDPERATGDVDIAREGAGSAQHEGAVAHVRRPRVAVGSGERDRACTVLADTARAADGVGNAVGDGAVVECEVAGCDGTAGDRAVRDRRGRGAHVMSVAEGDRITHVERCRSAAAGSEGEIRRGVRVPDAARVSCPDEGIHRAHHQIDLTGCRRVQRGGHVRIGTDRTERKGTGTADHPCVIKQPIGAGSERSRQRCDRDRPIGRESTRIEGCGDRRSRQHGHVTRGSGRAERDRARGEHAAAEPGGERGPVRHVDRSGHAGADRQRATRNVGGPRIVPRALRRQPAGSGLLDDRTSRSRHGAGQHAVRIASECHRARVHRP